MKNMRKVLPVVYLCRDPVDFRKGINGLAVLVEDVLCLDTVFGALVCVLQSVPQRDQDSVPGSAMDGCPCGKSVWISGPVLLAAEYAAAGDAQRDSS